MIAKPAKTREVNGTSLQGYVTITLHELMNTLGSPHRDGDKTTAEWAFKVDNVVLTIYDYKNESVPTEMYRWHIGGFNQKAVAAVAKLLPYHKVEGF